MANPTNLTSSISSVGSWAVHTERGQLQPKNCDNCSRQKWSFSRCHVMILLIVDVLIVLLVLRFHLHHHGGRELLGMQGHKWKSKNYSEDVRERFDAVVEDVRESVGGGVEDTGNVVDPKDDTRVPRGRSLDIIPYESPVLVLMAELNSTRKQLEDMFHLPAFSCHRVSDQPIESVVSYSYCPVTTDGMDANTGKFTVKTQGVYQVSFTGSFYIQKGHMVSSDIKIIKNGQSVSEAVVIGSASAKVNEDTRQGLFGTEYSGNDDTIGVTLTVAVLEKIYEGDVIYVWNYMAEKMDGDHGQTQLKSDFSRKIHFTARKVSDLTPT